MKGLEEEKLCYPIGRFKLPEKVTNKELTQFLSDIESLPSQMKLLVQNCSEQQLQLTYRKSGWSVKQILNHLVDSHSNSVIRFKLALTEAIPVIKPYDEAKWALLSDTQNCPIQLSLKLLDAIHQRWTILLKSLSNEDWEKKLFHPGSKIEYNLKQLAALYAWHGKHHLAHIQLALNTIG
ncbi:MAG: putative metal-dependent hydrolase [Bacteroidetes bacterium]|nr:putative metal-dependent hydrolase [Bacteroidota bacterium]